MKLFFSLFFLFLFTKNAFSNDYESKYIVKTKGITIGVLVWKLQISNKSYETKINLKNKGLLSNLYNFEGNYLTKGLIINKNLAPKQYIQEWTTNKKTRKVKIVFDSFFVKELSLFPIEKEHPRIQYGKIKNYKDPITSFLDILLNKQLSTTIDGRRVYLLTPEKTANPSKILIKEYKNIWADHKRNDLQYIEFYKNKKMILPKKINIKFKGSVFSLIRV